MAHGLEGLFSKNESAIDVEKSKQEEEKRKNLLEWYQKQARA